MSSTQLKYAKITIFIIFVVIIKNQILAKWHIITVLYPIFMHVLGSSAENPGIFSQNAPKKDLELDSFRLNHDF